MLSSRVSGREKAINKSSFHALLWIWKKRVDHGLEGEKHWALLLHTWVITIAKPFKFTLLIASLKHHFDYATSKFGIFHDFSLRINAVWVLMDGILPMGSRGQKSINKHHSQSSSNEGLSFLHCGVCPNHSWTWTFPTTVKSSSCSGCGHSNIPDCMFFQAFSQVKISHL